MGRPDKRGTDDEKTVLAFRVRKADLDAAIARRGSRKNLTDALVRAVEHEATKGQPRT